MDLILCHQTADFDALGAGVGLSLLYQGARTHPEVSNFLAFYRDECPLLEPVRATNTLRVEKL